MADDNKGDLIEKVIHVNRVSKVVKGGRRFSFSALVVSGDGNGRVGYGLGKANEVSEAVRKASEAAKKMTKAYSIYNTTIPHVVTGRFCSGKVIMKPAPPGSGVIAAGAVRAVMEAVGIQDINVKAIGSTNSHNLVKSAINGLSQLRSFDEVASLRNKSIEDIKLIDF